MRERAEPINATLRAVRRAAGVSLDVLASRTNFSKPYLSNVEGGRRRVTAEIAEAYDRALGTAGLLSDLLAADPGILVGRDDEAALLRQAVAELAAGRGRAVWVEGEPGIGKSALLAAGLARAALRGCRVLWAAADESLARFPLWVLLECLQVGPEGPDAARAQIAALLRGEGASGLTPGDAVLAAAERLLLLVEQWCAASPVMLVVDDMQWSDEVSLSVWERLRRPVRQMPLLLVAACRPVPRRAQLATLRRSLADHDAVMIRLGPLAHEQVAELTARLTGAIAGPALRQAANQAGGNPLYLREMLDALLREDQIRIRAGIAELTPTGTGAPASLAAAIASRLDFLSEDTRSVLRTAALLGPECSIRHLGDLAGRTASQLTGVLDEAVTAGVLAGSTTGLAFRHPLIRQALYEQIPAALRAALHRQAAHALAQTGAAVEVVAEQLLAGPEQKDAWVPGWLADGAAWALTYRAPQVAVQLLGWVLQQPSNTDPRREALTNCMVAALFRLGRYEEVEQLAPTVLARTTDVETAGRMAWTLGYALFRAGRGDEAQAVTNQVLKDRTLDKVWRARIGAFQAMALTNIGRYAEGQAAAAQAEAAGEQANDHLAIGYALHALSVAQIRQQDDPAAVQAIDRALAVIGEQQDTTDLRGLLLGNRMVALNNLGRLAEAEHALAHAVTLAERTGSPPRLAATRVQVADVYFYRGRWDNALAELDAAADLVASDPIRRIWLHGIAALIALHRDDPAALNHHLRATGDLQITDGELRHLQRWLLTAQALAAERDGQPEQALDQLLTAFIEPPSTLENPDLGSNCYLWLPDVTRLALSQGRPATAEAITTACITQAHKQPRPETMAVAQHCRGLLDSDPALLATAADTYHNGGFPLYRAHALENQAVLLAERGDTPAARTAYREAIDTYTSLDAAWDIHRADARLRRLAIRYNQRRRPATGRAALTPTELTISHLVADGHTNPEIAAQLQLSRRTVETHITHILAKLDAHSRLDITRLWHP
jgi:DNA-binding CsgD family transcriptional regulator/transcriptional regulator with XRE-family HTH domain